MQCVSGTILDPGSTPFKGYVCWDEGTIVELGRGTSPKEPAASGIITPLFINGHTHIGDSCFFGKIDPGIGLERIVNPPDGLKHRLLRTTPDSEIISGMEGTLTTMVRNGIGGFLDFREGGVQGIALLEEAVNRIRTDPGSQNWTPVPYIFSRPLGLGYDCEEIRQLLSRSGGIGVSAMIDWDYSELELLSAQVRSAGKLLALHASETTREDIDLMLDLKPDILIHLTSATPSDLQRVADAGIQVVICPRSNALFGFGPDIPLMLEKGISLSLGTDNLMFSTPDLIQEMRFALESTRSRGQRMGKSVTPDDILEMAGYRLRKALNVKSGLSQGEKAAFMVVSGPSTEPGSAAQSLIRQGVITLVVDCNSQWEVH